MMIDLAAINAFMFVGLRKRWKNIIVSSIDRKPTISEIEIKKIEINLYGKKISPISNWSKIALDQYILL